MGAPDLITTHEPDEQLTFVTTNTAHWPQHHHWVLGEYFDRYWTSILGPTAAALLRWIIRETRRTPAGRLHLTTSYLASAIGRPGARRPIGRTLDRLARFETLDIITASAPHVITAKTHLPRIGSCSYRRLHRDLQLEHDADLQRLAN